MKQIPDAEMIWVIFGRPEDNLGSGGLLRSKFVPIQSLIPSTEKTRILKRGISSLTVFYTCKSPISTRSNDLR